MVFVDPSHLLLNRFGMPQVLPLYYTADSYVISNWWQEKAR